MACEWHVLHAGGIARVRLAGGGSEPCHRMVSEPSALFCRSYHSQPTAPSALKPHPSLTIANVVSAVAGPGPISFPMIVPTGNSSVAPWGGAWFRYTCRGPEVCGLPATAGSSYDVVRGQASCGSRGSPRCRP